MFYSKNGSIPKPETDGTEGWIEVPDAPEAPEGKEVVWWYPPGWIIRDPQPGTNWSWSQTEERWIEYVPAQIIADIPEQQLSALSSSDVIALTSSDIGML